MTRQTSSLRQAENTLFTDDIGGTGSVILNLAFGLAKKAGRAAYIQAAGNELENSFLYKTGQRIASFSEDVQTRTEDGEDLGSVLLGFGREYATSAVDRTITRAREYVPGFAQRKLFENYVRGFLQGKTYGATVLEGQIDTFVNERYVENGQQKTGALGMQGYENGRKVVRIPKAGDIGALIGSELSDSDARAVQKYIKGHEILEANAVTGPASDAEHAPFEAAYLASLERLSRFSDSAREAYRGAMIVYKARSANNREFLDEVSEHFPVRTEMWRAG